MILNNTTFLQAAPAQQPDTQAELLRESEWLDKFSQQQDKINNLKYKVSMLQQELKMERDQNEQTIENFTVLCQDLKFKGAEEAEDLQADISIIKEQMRKLSCEKAYHEVKIMQLADEVEFYSKDNEELRGQVRDLRCQLIQSEIDREMHKVESLQSTSHEDEALNEEREEELQTLRATVFDLQVEIDQLKWRNVTLEAEKL